MSQIQVCFLYCRFLPPQDKCFLLVRSIRFVAGDWAEYQFLRDHISALGLVSWYLHIGRMVDGVEIAPDSTTPEVAVIFIANRYIDIHTVGGR